MFGFRPGGRRILGELVACSASSVIFTLSLLPWQFIEILDYLSGLWGLRQPRETKSRALQIRSRSICSLTSLSRTRLSTPQLITRAGVSSCISRNAFLKITRIANTWTAWPKPEFLPRESHSSTRWTTSYADLVGVPSRGRRFHSAFCISRVESHGILVIACDMRRLENLAYTQVPTLCTKPPGMPIVADPEFRDFLRGYGEVARNAIFTKRDLEIYDAIRDLWISRKTRKRPPPRSTRLKNILKHWLRRATSSAKPLSL